MKYLRVTLRVDGCGDDHLRRGSEFDWVAEVEGAVGGGEWTWVSGQKRRLRQRVLFQLRAAVEGVPQCRNPQKKVKIVAMTPCLSIFSKTLYGPEDAGGLVEE